jgi:hypothetical protein
MGKKKSDIRLSPAQLVRPGQGDVATQATVSTRKSNQPVDLQQEYRYVITDLKRIGLIAVGMLGLLIVLAFLLT